MSLKIAVYHNLPSGGGKRALHEMVKHLTGSHELEVFTTSSADHDFCDLRPYIAQYRIYPFKPLMLFRSPFGRVNAALRTLDLFRLDEIQRKIATDIDQQNYDLVFVHNCRYSQAPGLIRYLHTKSIYYCGEPPRGFTEPHIARPYFKRSSTRQIVDCIDPLPGYYRRTLLQLDRASTMAATKVLVNSAYSRESFYRIYGQFATTCYLGVDCDKFHPIGLKRQPYVFSVGSLGPKKGFDFLIESLALIPSDQRPALVLACNEVNPLEKIYLEGLAHRYAVQLEIQALISDNDMVELYNQALLTVYAPVMEPFGFVPIESMSCGTPVIGVNEAGVRETIIDNVTGLLIEREPDHFAKSILNLLSNPSLASEYGCNGREYVLQNWTWDKSIEKLEAHLKSVAALDN